MRRERSFFGSLSPRYTRIYIGLHVDKSWAALGLGLGAKKATFSQEVDVGRTKNQYRLCDAAQGSNSEQNTVRLRDKVELSACLDSGIRV